MATTVKKRKSNKMLIIVLLVLIVIIALVYLLMSNSGGKTATGGATLPAATPTSNVELIDIVVASQKITRGSLITAEYLTTIKYPKNDAPADTFFTRIEDAVGTKAIIDILPGYPLTTNMVIHEGEGSLASMDIPSGMTAASIKISPETAVAYAPQKGDHVMVVGCLLLVDVDTSFQTILPNKTAVTYPEGSKEGENGAPSSSMYIIQSDSYADKGRYELDGTTNELLYVTPSEAQRGRLVCQTIIQDAEVLGIGYFPLSDDQSATQAATPVVLATVENSTPQGVVYPGSVTLIVSPQDMLILKYLELAGTQLSLALRSSGDTSIFNTDAVTLQYVMDQKNIPSPVKLPYATEPRVDVLVYPSYNDYVMQP